MPGSNRDGGTPDYSSGYEPRPFSSRIFLIVIIAGGLAVLAALSAGIAAWSGVDSDSDAMQLLAALSAAAVSGLLTFFGAVLLVNRLIQ